VEGRFRNGFLPRIGLCIVTAVVAIVAVEIVVRLVFAESLRLSIAEMIKRKAVAQTLLASEASEATQQLCRVHPFFGHTMRAQMDASPLGWRIETDRNGFRNQSNFDIRDIPDDVIVIGLFGGSAAFGWEIDGNEGTLASHLEKQFNSIASPGTKYRVVNLAIPGWHYPQQFYLISRIIQHLDGIITFDGFNEIMVPVGNTLAYKQLLPPDFPSGLFYLSNFQKQRPEQTLAMYGLLEFDRSYDPNSLLAKLGLYNLWRYRQARSKRNQALRTIQLGSQLNKTNVPTEESIFKRDILLYDSIVEYGISEHAKYSQMVDLIASEYGIPVLHVLQPFMYTDPKTRVDRKSVPKYARFVFANGHPSIHYMRLRNRFKELAQHSESQNSIQYLDLADALAGKEANWIDLIHPSSEGNRLAAEKIRSFVESSGIEFKPQADPD
jgi:hypothetical protein